MRSATQYEYTLENDNNVTITAGDYEVSLAFRWPTVIQEQWDILQRKIPQLASSDPILKEDGTYYRDYSYLDYYNEIPELGDGLEEWIESNTEWPQSLRDGLSISRLNIILNRKEFCKDLQQYLDDLEAMLVYTCTITIDGVESVMSIRPGAYCRWRDPNISVRFLSDIEKIGKDDLTRVTVECMTYEFV